LLQVSNDKSGRSKKGKEQARQANFTLKMRVEAGGTVVEFSRRKKVTYTDKHSDFGYSLVKS
jgi:hypothetical protein